jgi:hypothetical protein
MLRFVVEKALAGYDPVLFLIHFGGGKILVFMLGIEVFVTIMLHVTCSPSHMQTFVKNLKFAFSGFNIIFASLMPLHVSIDMVISKLFIYLYFLILALLYSFK